MATGCSGMRSMTVPRVCPRFQFSDGAWWTMRLSPPGQKARMRSRAGAGVLTTRPSMVSHDPTRTGTGMSGPRCLADSSRLTASGSKASAAMP